MMLKVKKLENFLIKFFISQKLSKEKSKSISKKLLKSDMAGQFSHGSIRVIQYYNAIKQKKIKINALPELKRKNNFLYLNGKFYFGQLVMDQACKEVIRANKDISLVAVKNIGHFGRLTDYAEKLCENGYVSVFFASGGGPNTSLYPGKLRVIGTNPISIGVPISKKDNFIVDFATASIAEGKVSILNMLNKKLDKNYIIKKNGELSNNPKDFYKKGSLMPFGEIKGSSLAFALEIISGILISQNNSSQKNFKNYIDGNNCLFFVFKKNLFKKNFKYFNKQFYFLRKKILKSRLKNLKKEKSYLPGDWEKFNQKKALKFGINYPNFLYKKLKEFSEINKLPF